MIALFNVPYPVAVCKSYRVGLMPFDRSGIASDCTDRSTYKPVVCCLPGVFQSSLDKLLSDFLIGGPQNAQSINTGRFHDHLNVVILFAESTVISSFRASIDPFGIFPAFSLAMLISTRMIITFVLVEYTVFSER